MKQLAFVLITLGLCALPAAAQMGNISGIVKGADGKGIEGATVVIEKFDTKKNYDVKTNKKGEYGRAGIPGGLYSLQVVIDGQVRAKVVYYNVATGTNRDWEFKLLEPGAGVIGYECNPDSPSCIIFDVRKPTAPATTNGVPSLAPPPPIALPKSAAKDDKASAKEREAELQKNAALNEAYAAGKNALSAKQFQVAVDNFEKAIAIDPTRVVIWNGAADAYAGLAKQSPDDRAANYEKSFAAYKKVLEMTPDATPDAAVVYNSYALAQAGAGRLDDARASLAKAVQLDSTRAGLYHFNMGALLVTSNQTDAGIAEFRTSIEADPNYAEAYFQLGAAQLAKATLNASGKMVAPAGTIEALEKYLSLQPDGPNAQGAREMIVALGATIKSSYKDATAPAPKPAAPKKAK